MLLVSYMETYTATISPDLQGRRLDKALATLFDNFSRNRLSNLVEAGHVLIDDQQCAENKTKVMAGQNIILQVPPAIDTALKPENISLDILFEDEHLIVLNKAAGMVVHPAAGNWSGTLVNALLYHCGDSILNIGGENRPGIVHRLDKDTSGVMVVAKTGEAHAKLAYYFEQKEIIRGYQAFCYGQPIPPAGIINKNIGRHPKDRLKMAVVNPGGKKAITHYKLIESFQTYCHIECRLETGRTHQIRVHMAHLGHALLGDKTYGGRMPGNLSEMAKNLQRQALHAYELGFIHPITLKSVLFQQPLPEDMQQLLHS